MYDSNDNSGFLNDSGEIASRFSNITLLSESQNGYSEVYKAKRYGQWFVLKRLIPDVADILGYRNLQQKEFLIAVSLNHPNIAKTIDIEVVENLGLCIIEEYIDGETWDVFFSRTKPNREDTKRIIGEVCSALEYIHSRQYVHRDLKPTNVMITHNGHHVKLLDFGLADNDSFDIIKSVAGSARYAAPELQKAVPSDGRVDIYSLGVMLNELTKPWLALKMVSRRCCQQQREKRYASAEAVYAALNRHIVFTKTLSAIVLLLGMGIGLYYIASEGRRSMSTTPLNDTTTNAGETPLLHEGTLTAHAVETPNGSPWSIHKQLETRAIDAARRIVEQNRPLLNDKDFTSAEKALWAIRENLSLEKAQTVAMSVLEGQLDADDSMYKTTASDLHKAVYKEFFGLIVEAFSDFLSHKCPDLYPETEYYYLTNDLTGERSALNWTALYRDKHGNDLFHTLTPEEYRIFQQYYIIQSWDTTGAKALSEEEVIRRIRSGKIKAQ